MAEIKWIKITTSMFDDEKIKLIEAMPDKDSILIIWIKLLLLAGKVNQGGNIYLSETIPYTDEMLSTVFNRPLNTVRLALETFRKFGMIECNVTSIFIVNWNKHQSIDILDKIREDTRKRVQKFRAKTPLIEAKTSNDNSNVTVTLRNDIRRRSKKKNKTIKEIYKEKVTPESIKPIFYSFQEDGYSDIVDFDNQFKKFCEYWFDGNRNILNPKLACHNWLDKAREYQKKNTKYQPPTQQYEAVN